MPEWAQGYPFHGANAHPVHRFADGACMGLLRSILKANKLNPTPIPPPPVTVDPGQEGRLVIGRPSANQVRMCMEFIGSPEMSSRPWRFLAQMLHHSRRNCPRQCPLDSEFQGCEKPPGELERRGARVTREKLLFEDPNCRLALGNPCLVRKIQGDRRKCVQEKEENKNRTR